MLDRLRRKISFWRFMRRQEEMRRDRTQLLSTDLNENVSRLRKQIGANDLIIRTITINNRDSTRAALVYIDGLVNNAVVYESIVKPLTVAADKRLKEAGDRGLAELLKTSIVTVGEAELTRKFGNAVFSVLSGDSLLLIDKSPQALILGSKGWPARSIQEPDTEVVLRGPREGFTETLRVNTALLRRHFKSPILALETMTLGEHTQTEICIAYLKGITNEKLVEEVRRRLKRINTDAILESGYIEEFIEDAPFSPFATISHTERPDVAAGKLLEGRVAILVDGTPIALTVPTLFVETFQTPDDYYSRFIYVSMLRWLRYIAFFLSVTAPAIYVALTTYHQELIPTPLLLTMAAARKGVPFPAVIEALGMILVFEIMREAGLRLPRPIGQAMSIVGALVIGEAAVSAGLVGAPMIIVIAITGIASFVVPALSEVSLCLREIFAVLAAVLGGYGIGLGMLGVLIHLSSLRSFGVPYLSPLAPLSPGDQKDVVIREPIWRLVLRPRAIGWRNPQRQAFDMRPDDQSDGVHNELEK